MKTAAATASLSREDIDRGRRALRGRVLVTPVVRSELAAAGSRGVLGAEVIQVGRRQDERVAEVERISAARGYDVVDPYQDPDVVTGQRTATAELIDQAEAAGDHLDALVIPVGGGSALAGACLAAADHGLDVLAAEPAAMPALTAALQAGAPVTVAATIADGLRPERIGALPF